MVSSRPTCEHCRRPQTSCICNLACAIENQVEVLILQHPLEVDQAKGTARLLHLCLKNSRIDCGETFDPAFLQARLVGKQNLLLYPETATASNAQPPPGFPGHTPPETLRLIVLDGTWRKSRKLLHLNPPLAQLPRFSLDVQTPGAYSIRKAQAGHQLSTLEATARALAQLENNPARYHPLEASFAAFIDFQRALRQPH